MNNKVLTIIVPSYNMELYLDRSVESILADEVMGDIEILIVNDGSKDKTLEIAKGYQMKFPESVVVVDKENGNYGSVLNIGIEMAKGKYLKTLDADDWYDKKAFVKYIGLLKECDEDLVINGYSYFFEKEKKRIPAFTYKEKYWSDSIDIVENNLYELNLDYQLNMPAMAFKTSVIRNANFKLLEKTFYTDTEYVYYPFGKVRTIRLLPIDLYVYYIGRQEQTVTPENILRNFDSKYRIIKKMLQDFLNEKDSVFKINKKFSLIKNIKGFYCYIYLSNEHREEINEIDNMIKMGCSDIYEELGNKVNAYGVNYLQLHRAGNDYVTITKRIEISKKRYNSLLNRGVRKILRIIKRLWVKLR